LSYPGMIIKKPVNREEKAEGLYPPDPPTQEIKLE